MSIDRRREILEATKGHWAQALASSADWAAQRDDASAFTRLTHLKYLLQTELHRITNIFWRW